MSVVHLGGKGEPSVRVAENARVLLIYAQALHAFGEAWNMPRDCIGEFQRVVDPDVRVATEVCCEVLGVVRASAQYVRLGAHLNPSGDGLHLTSGSTCLLYTSDAADE